jgi:hypothetical protein
MKKICMIILMFLFCGNIVFSETIIANDKNITIKLYNVSTVNAIQMILGQNYIINNDVNGQANTISATFPDKDSALNAALRGTNITFNKDENNIYIFNRKIDTTSIERILPIVDAIPPIQKIKIEKISLLFADASDIASFFGVEVSPSRFNMNSNNSNSFGMNGIGNNSNSFGMNGMGNNSNYGIRNNNIGINPNRMY